MFLGGAASSGRGDSPRMAARAQQVNYHYRPSFCSLQRATLPPLAARYLEFRFVSSERRGTREPASQLAERAAKGTINQSAALDAPTSAATSWACGLAESDRKFNQMIAEVLSVASRRIGKATECFVAGRGRDNSRSRM